MTQQCPQCQEINTSEATFCNRCGMHLAGVENPMIDRIIGKFRLREKIGSGGFGSVYKAEHVELANPFAVKILHPHFAGNRLMVERFKREARLLASLRHENIVQIIDFGHMPGVGSYLIMEWLEGKTFQWHIQRFGIPPRHILLQIFEQLLGALDVAHRHGVVHRDLKPENLILLEGVGDRRTLKILDFGVARIVSHHDDQSPALTETGLAVGTPRYMSPEQARGDLHDIDGRTDIYAAGVLLVELLTGRTLFGGNTNEILIQQIDTPHPKLHELAPHMQFAPRLEAVVDRVLAKDKHDRFPTARAFSEALLPLLLEESGFNSSTGISVALSAIRQGVRIEPSLSPPRPKESRPATTGSETRALAPPRAPAAGSTPQHTAERYNGERVNAPEQGWLDLDENEKTTANVSPPQNWIWGTVGLLGGLLATILVFLIGTASWTNKPAKNRPLPAPPSFARQPIVLDDASPLQLGAAEPSETPPDAADTAQPDLPPTKKVESQPRRKQPQARRPNARKIRKRRKRPRRRRRRRAIRRRRRFVRTRRRPPPRRVTPQQRFTLRLRVVPKGAEILVDGIRKGYTKTSIQAPQGQKIKILIRKEGYLSQTLVWKANKHERRSVRLAENIF